MLQRPGPIPPIQPPAGQAHKTAISWNPAYLSETVDKVEALLIERQASVFICDNQLVRPVSRKVLGASIWHAQGEEVEQHTTAWELEPLTPGALAVQVNKFAYFFNDDKASKAVDMPKAVMAGLMSPDLSATKLPMLRGVSSVPYLYADGAISAPGYDAELQIYFDTYDLYFDAWPVEPTFEDCQQSIQYLKWFVREFPFSGPVDRSVALLGFLSAAARISIFTCPMIGFTAPIRGSGKSLLTDMISIAATGAKAPIINYGSNQDEFEKRIDGTLLAGSPLISIDNVEAPLRSSTLNSYLTGADVKIRLFLSQRFRRAVPSIMFFVNGNNLSVADDLDRRMLMSKIDPRVERPELEPHSFNPIQLCRAHRDDIVRCIFTILRGYIVAGNPLGSKYTLGSFEEWSEHVLAPLLWAADGDPEIGNPLDSIETIRSENPTISFELEFKRTWYEHFKDRPVQVSELLLPDFKDRPIFRALKDLTNSRGNEISTQSIGKQLRKIKDRAHEGYRLVQFDKKDSTIRWRVIHEGEK